MAPEDALRRLLTTLGYVLLWYTFSIGITFYNKWLFLGYDFDFPLSVTVIHMFMTSFLAGLHRSYRRRQGEELPSLDLQTIARRVFAAGATGALDIGLSNVSISLIHISVYTIAKSTLLVWLLLFAFVFKLEKPSISLFGVILFIVVGVGLFKYDPHHHAEERDNPLGVILVFLAAMMGGLRWVLTQLILKKETLGLTHPVDTVYYVSPCMAITLLPIALFDEGRGLLNSSLLFEASVGRAIETILAILFGACLAFFLTLSEFLLVSRTSGVTLSVAGIFKEICTVLLAVALLSSEHLTGMNVLGLVISIVGIAFYNYLKWSKADEDDRPSNGQYLEMVPVKTGARATSGIFKTRRSKP